MFKSGYESHINGVCDLKANEADKQSSLCDDCNYDCENCEESGFCKMSDWK